MAQYDKLLPSISDLLEVLATNTPLIDVRAPIEFSAGAFTNAVNLPLMNDEERHLIGICYKKEGHNAAVKLGHQMVSGAVKDQRIQAWTDYIAQFPNAHIMCFRGGMRSKIAQTWVSEHIGREIPRIAGGYKALRRLAINILEEPFKEMPAYIIGGHTGAGKTPFLNHLATLTPKAGAIDLEGLAKHRGSAFGNRIEAQPPQATFENALAQQLILKKHLGASALFFENESRAIGRVMLPQQFMNHLQELPLLVLTSPLSERVERTWQEYVVDALEEYISFFGEEIGPTQWASDLRERMSRIQKRLGLERYKAVSAVFESALLQHDLHGHREWIEVLLSSYYDPMYTHQRDKWEKNVRFEGNSEDLTAYILKNLL